MRKILISAPTAGAKNYCLKEYLENVYSFKYPKSYWDLVLFDNTDDGGINTDFINQTIKELFGNVNNMKAIHSNIKGVSSTIQKMAISSNEMRDYFLANKEYSHLFSLESDVLPESPIIENLMFHRRHVTGALYFRDMGRWRKLTIQNLVRQSPENMRSFNMVAGDEATFVDGTLKKVGSVGLGCVLISRTVLEKIKFKYMEGLDIHPDTFFSEDVYANGWDIWADTSQIAKHKNQAWGIYKEDYH